MIDDGKPIEVNCHFCSRNYTFDVEELKEILEWPEHERHAGEGHPLYGNRIYQRYNKPAGDLRTGSYL